jgi:glycosyltransferase involved in cell wall biosynthesis
VRTALQVWRRDDTMAVGKGFGHHHTRLCLNMIMKNEEHVLRETFDSVADEIAGWFICDTGSNDSSIELTKSYFRRRQIPGKLVHHGWTDFATNRNRCMDEGRESMSNHCDYWIIFDADQQLVNETPTHLWQYMLDGEGYYIKERSNGIYFSNPRILKVGTTWMYTGAIHESVVPRPDHRGKVTWPDMGELPEGFWSIHDTDRSRSLESDVEILLKDLEKNANDTRTHFYLAKAYREIPGRMEESLHHFAARVSLEGPHEDYVSQEYYFSLYSIAHIFETLFVADKLEPKHGEILRAQGLINGTISSVQGIAALYEQAMLYSKQRFEPYGNIAKLYWFQEHNAQECYRYASLGLKVGKKGNALSNMFYTDESLHCLYFMKCVCGFHLGKFEGLVSTCRYNVDNVAPAAGNIDDNPWMHDYKAKSMYYLEELQKLGVD